jgi:hypothetical protein
MKTILNANNYYYQQKSQVFLRNRYRVILIYSGSHLSGPSSGKGESQTEADRCLPNRETRRFSLRDRIQARAAGN